MSRKITTALAVASMSLMPILAVTAPAEASSKARTFANCTDMNRVYPHGVGRPGARDRTSGIPVRNFKRSKALYKANTKSDRDKDGIACEKR